MLFSFGATASDREHNRSCHFALTSCLLFLFFFQPLVGPEWLLGKDDIHPVLQVDKAHKTLLYPAARLWVIFLYRTVFVCSVLWKNNAMLLFAPSRKWAADQCRIGSETDPLSCSSTHLHGWNHNTPWPSNAPVFSANKKPSDLALRLRHKGEVKQVTVRQHQVYLKSQSGSMKSALLINHPIITGSFWWNFFWRAQRKQLNSY